MGNKGSTAAGARSLLAATDTTPSAAEEAVASVGPGAAAGAAEGGVETHEQRRLLSDAKRLLEAQRLRIADDYYETGQSVLADLVDFVDSSELTWMCDPGRALDPALGASPSIAWKRGELLGAGAFGKVYLGLNETDGTLLAAKQISILMSRTSGKKEALTIVAAVEGEIALMRRLKHDNVVRYLGCHRGETSGAPSAAPDRDGGTSRPPPTAFTEETLTIFMEYVPGGSLASLIRRFGSLNEHLCRLYTRQLLTGLAYLHAHGVVHRDVKCANALLDRTGTVKLTDFGASRDLWELEQVAGGQAGPQSLRGTPAFMAPEVIRQTGHGRKADCWSIGCTVIEMSTGRPPFSQYDNAVSAMFAIATTEEVPLPPAGFSVEAQEFLALCFQRDPKKRPTAAQLLRHPWIVAAGAAQQHPAVAPAAATAAAAGFAAPSLGGGTAGSPPTPSPPAATHPLLRPGGAGAQSRKGSAPGSPSSPALPHGGGSGAKGELAGQREAAAAAGVPVMPPSALPGSSAPDAHLDDGDFAGVTGRTARHGSVVSRGGAAAATAASAPPSTPFCNAAGASPPAGPPLPLGGREDAAPPPHLSPQELRQAAPSPAASPQHVQQLHVRGHRESGGSDAWDAAPVIFRKKSHGSSLSGSPAVPRKSSRGQPPAAPAAAEGAGVTPAASSADTLSPSAGAASPPVSPAVLLASAIAERQQLLQQQPQSRAGKAAEAPPVEQDSPVSTPGPGFFSRSSAATEEYGGASGSTASSSPPTTPPSSAPHSRASRLSRLVVSPGEPASSGGGGGGSGTPASQPLSSPVQPLQVQGPAVGAAAPASAPAGRRPGPEGRAVRATLAPLSTTALSSPTLGVYPQPPSTSSTNTGSSGGASAASTTARQVLLLSPLPGATAAPPVPAPASSHASTLVFTVSPKSSRLAAAAAVGAGGLPANRTPSGAGAVAFPASKHFFSGPTAADALALGAAATAAPVLEPSMPAREARAGLLPLRSRLAVRGELRTAGAAVGQRGLMVAPLRHSSNSDEEGVSGIDDDRLTSSSAENDPPAGLLAQPSVVASSSPSLHDVTLARKQSAAAACSPPSSSATARPLRSSSFSTCTLPANQWSADAVAGGHAGSLSAVGRSASGSAAVGAHPLAHTTGHPQQQQQQSEPMQHHNGGGGVSNAHQRSPSCDAPDLRGSALTPEPLPHALRSPVQHLPRHHTPLRYGSPGSSNGSLLQPEDHGTTPGGVTSLEPQIRLPFTSSSSSSQVRNRSGEGPSTAAAAVQGQSPLGTSGDAISSALRQKQQQLLLLQQRRTASSYDLPLARGGAVPPGSGSPAGGAPSGSPRPSGPIHSASFSAGGSRGGALGVSGGGLAAPAGSNTAHHFFREAVGADTSGGGNSSSSGGNSYTGGAMESGHQRRQQHHDPSSQDVIFPTTPGSPDRQQAAGQGGALQYGLVSHHDTPSPFATGQRFSLFHSELVPGMASTSPLPHSSGTSGSFGATLQQSRAPRNVRAPGGGVLHSPAVLEGGGGAELLPVPIPLAIRRVVAPPGQLLLVGGPSPASSLHPATASVPAFTSQFLFTQPHSHAVGGHTHSPTVPLFPNSPTVPLFPPASDRVSLHPSSSTSHGSSYVAGSGHGEGPSPGAAAASAVGSLPSPSHGELSQHFGCRVPGIGDAFQADISSAAAPLTGGSNRSTLPSLASRGSRAAHTSTQQQLGGIVGVSPTHSPSSSYNGPSSVRSGAGVFASSSRGGGLGSSLLGEHPAGGGAPAAQTPGRGASFSEATWRGTPSSLPRLGGGGGGRGDDVVESFYAEQRRAVTQARSHPPFDDHDGVVVRTTGGEGTDAARQAAPSSPLPHVGVLPGGVSGHAAGAPSPLRIRTAEHLYGRDHQGPVVATHDASLLISGPLSSGGGRGHFSAAAPLSAGSSSHHSSSGPSSASFDSPVLFGGSAGSVGGQQVRAAATAPAPALASFRRRVLSTIESDGSRDQDSEATLSRLASPSLVGVGGLPSLLRPASFRFRTDHHPRIRSDTDSNLEEAGGGAAPAVLGRARSVSLTVPASAVGANGGSA